METAVLIDDLRIAPSGQAIWDSFHATDELMLHLVGPALHRSVPDGVGYLREFGRSGRCEIKNTRLMIGGDGVVVVTELRENAFDLVEMICARGDDHATTDSVRDELCKYEEEKILHM